MKRFSLACCVSRSQECFDGIETDWNLNCLEHQFSGWSCDTPCVDCDGTPCGDYWISKLGTSPLYAVATLGDGTCDYGQESEDADDGPDEDFGGSGGFRGPKGSAGPRIKFIPDAVPNHLNWNCEKFKFDLYVLFSMSCCCFLSIMQNEQILFFVGICLKSLE